jgi:hypothetical protein
MAIEKELLDQLLGGRDPNEVFAKGGLLDDLRGALSERILNAEPHPGNGRSWSSLSIRPTGRGRDFFTRTSMPPIR